MHFMAHLLLFPPVRLSTKIVITTLTSLAVSLHDQLPKILCVMLLMSPLITIKLSWQTFASNCLIKDLRRDFIFSNIFRYIKTIREKCEKNFKFKAKVKK